MASRRANRREVIEQESREKPLDAMEDTIATLVAELKADASVDKIRAALAILDRVLDRPSRTLKQPTRLSARAAAATTLSSTSREPHQGRQAPFCQVVGEPVQARQRRSH
jgi:hypothetical protein